MDDTDEHKENSLDKENEPELEEENAPTTKTKKETPKHAEITKVPFPSRLEEKQKQDEDEFVSFLTCLKH